MLGRIVTGSTLIAAILLLYIMQITTPSSAGPVGILAVFFLLYVFLVGLITWATRGASLVLARLVRPLTIKRPLQAVTLSHAYYLSSIIALAPVMLLGIGSVGGFQFYDIALVILFVAIGVFYVEKRIR